MGKPPSFKIMNGAHTISPGPAAYIIRDAIDELGDYNGTGKYSPSRTNGYNNGENSFRARKRSVEMKHTLKAPHYIPSMTTSNFAYKESGPRFGSFERQPLN